MNRARRIIVSTLLGATAVALAVVPTATLAAPPAGGQTRGAAAVCRDFESASFTAEQAAEKITDTSGMWEKATCTAFVAGSATTAPAWVFAVAVVPDVLRDGVGVCTGLWTAPASDGVLVSCEPPDVSPPEDLELRTVTVEQKGAREQFVVGRAPVAVDRVEVRTRTGGLSTPGRRPSDAWPVHYFAAKIADPGAIVEIEARGADNQVLGKTDRVEPAPRKLVKRLRAKRSAPTRSFDLVGAENAVLIASLGKRQEAFARLSLDR